MYIHKIRCVRCIYVHIVFSVAMYIYSGFEGEEEALAVMAAATELCISQVYIRTFRIFIYVHVEFSVAV